jgi:opacity protein-like surface antigen
MRHTVLALLSFAVLAAPAQAATAPTPHSAPATNVGPLSATLNGDVNANGHATTIHFEYGTTKRYGQRTPAQQVGAGTTPIPVSASISGLKSNTRYHFRLVAVSGVGTKASGDRAFKTAKPTTTPTFTPNPVVFSRPFTVSGQLTGTGSAHATVTLLARPFPFTAPFAKMGNSVVSNADGTYSFPFTAALGTAQFEIHADTNPPITTPVATMQVASLVSLHVPTHVRKGHLARFSGLVLPAQDGLVVKIQKRGRDGVFHTVAHTNLRHKSASASFYSRRLRLKRTGTYQAVVQSAGGTVYPGASPAKSIKVRRR